MSVVRSQQQVFLRLLRQLQPDWRRDFNLPQRIQHLLARDRAFGSRDRRLYRELLYTVLRYLPWIEPLLENDPGRAAQITAWLAADTRDTRAYRAELCPDWPAPRSPTAPNSSRRMPPPCCPRGFTTNARTSSPRPNWRRSSPARHSGCDCRQTTPKEWQLILT